MVCLSQQGMHMKLLIICSVIQMLWIFNNVSEAQWTQTNGPNGGNIYSLAVNGTNVFAGNLAGVYFSSNSGTNWTKLNLGPFKLTVSSLLINGANIFAGTDSGAYLSTDGGAFWTRAGLNNIPVYTMIIKGTTIFAGTFYHGIYLSTNNGIDWTQTSMNSALVNALAISGNNIWAGTGSGVFFSTDNGATWTNTGLNYDVRSLAMIGSSIYAGTYISGVYISTNNGTNWTKSSSGLTRPDIYALTARGDTLFAATSGGVFRSTNKGINWGAINKGLVYPFIYSLAFNENDIFAGTDGEGVWRRSLADITDIQKEMNYSPGAFSLEQNYPNPFNPGTIISYRLKEKGFVRLSVYDSKGSLVKILINETKEPGFYEVKFEAKGLSSGVYFNRLEIFGENSIPVYSEVKKSVLLK
jgi:hypothetical protein